MVIKSCSWSLDLLLHVALAGVTELFSRCLGGSVGSMRGFAVMSGTLVRMAVILETWVLLHVLLGPLTGMFHQIIQTSNTVVWERNRQTPQTEPLPHRLLVNSDREPAQFQAEGTCASLLVGRSVRAFLATFFFFFCHCMNHSLTCLFSVSCHSL